LAAPYKKKGTVANYQHLPAPPTIRTEVLLVERDWPRRNKNTRVVASKEK
jgi:hypothetical protein